MSTFWKELLALGGWLLIYAVFLGFIFEFMFYYHKFFKFLDRKPSPTHGISQSKVHIVITIALAIIAVYFAVTTKVSAQSILQYIFPSEDFERIEKMFEEIPQGWIITQILYVLGKEFLDCIFYVAPVFILDIIYALCASFCKVEDKENKRIIAILKIVASFAIFVIASSVDVTELIKSYWTFAMNEVEEATGMRTVVMGIMLYSPIVLLIAYSVKALFGNKIILTILGFNFARIIIRTPFEPWQEVLYIIYCFAFGYFLEQVQFTFLDDDTDEEDFERPVVHTLHAMLYGLIYLALTIGVGIPFVLIAKYIF